MYELSLTTVILRYVFFHGITLVLGVIALLLTRKGKKWVFILCTACLIGVVALAARNVIPVVLDYKTESYITENNVKVICRSPWISFSDLGNSSLTVVTEDGRTIHLWHSGPFEKGQFQGTIVYAKRSRVVVSYDLEPESPE